MRRTLKANKVNNVTKRMNIRSDRRQKLVDGRRVQRAQKDEMIHILHTTLETAGYIKKSPTLSQADTKQRSLDLLHSAGISLSTSTKINKKTFSLVKDQSTPRIVQNPVILDIEAYRNVIRTPLKASEIFKNKNDPLFSAATKISRSEYRKIKKHIEIRRPDLTQLVVSNLKRYSGPSAAPPLRIWSKNKAPYQSMGY